MNNVERDAAGKWVPLIMNGKQNVGLWEYNTKGNIE